MSIDHQRTSPEEAIRNCRERARVSANLAAAFFDLGRSALLLGNSSESLAAYAKACQLSETEEPIEAGMRSLTRLEEFAGVSHQEMKCTGRLLFVARVAKLLSLEEKARTAAAEKALAANEREKLLRRLEKQPAVGQKLIEEAKCQSGDARNALREAQSRVRETEQKANAALDQLHPLALKPEDPLTRPVIVVAGGCDPDVAPQVNEYRSLLERAFENFSGTIISGGTTAGISGIVAGLKGDMKKIAHLPRRESLPRSAVPDNRFQIRWMESDEGLTVLQAIQYWIDLLVSGIKPAEVKLLGINGGEISAFEYRFALALGAEVGILRDSGREAARLSIDPDWKMAAGLAMLPADEDSVRAFIMQGTKTR
jgi:tetratricopeptide (TPR) repeat protein